MKNEGARVVTTLYSYILDAQVQLTLLLVVGMADNLTHSIFYGHNISPIISLWRFSRRSRAANSTVQRRIWPNFKPIRKFMGVYVACNNEEDPINSEGPGVVTTFLTL